MDYTELGKILSEYVRRFDEFNDPSTHDEGYKWRAISHFRQNWDIDAGQDSFLQMFKAAMAKQVNLFDGQYKRPLGGIRKLLRDRRDYDFIHQQFSLLFSDDGRDLDLRQERAQLFAESVNGRVWHFFPTEKQSKHDLQDAINYLSFWRPADNFIYKPMSAHKMADIINFEGDLGWGAYFSLSEYYKMCEEISAAFDEFPEVLERSEARRIQYAPELDSTASRHITVYDIIYCTYQYDLNGVQSRPSVPRKERLAAAENQRLRTEKEAEIAALQDQLQEVETTTDALPDLTGQVVYHKAFGRGIVQSCANGRLAVSFPQKGDPVTFGYNLDKINCIIGGFVTPEDKGIIAKVQSAFGSMNTIQRLTTQIASATKELDKLLNK